MDHVVSISFYFLEKLSGGKHLRFFKNAIDAKLNG